LDERLKQRLVGAIVLVALAVIFIPMILDGGDDRSLPAHGEAIPDKPATLKRLEKTKPAAVDIPAPPPIVERRLIDDQAAPPQPDTRQSEITKPNTNTKKAAADDNSKQASLEKSAKAWVVQVGSFEHQKNALALRDRLRKYQYRAFVESVKNNGSVIYRVRIGPEVRRSSAEQIQQKLKARHKINGVVMGHP
jgi:DedD protein